MFAFIKLMGADIVRTATSEFRGMSVENAKRTTIDIRQMCEIVRINETKRFRRRESLNNIRF